MTTTKSALDSHISLAGVIKELQNYSSNAKSQAAAGHSEKDKAWSEGNSHGLSLALSALYQLRDEIAHVRQHNATLCAYQKDELKVEYYNGIEDALSTIWRD